MQISRYFLLVAVVWTAPSFAGEQVFAHFDGADFAGWTTTGDAFGDSPARGGIDGQPEIVGFRGKGFANSFHGQDKSQGTLISGEFKISTPYINFMIGGGNHPVETGIELLIGDERVRTATGKDLEVLRWHSWDVRDLAGKRARFRIFDHASGDQGHVLIDEIMFNDTPRSGYEFPKLDAYRQSADFRRERFRPAYHFTPDLNWTNDPNGLVFFNGEYHLFYQHNPWGNRWGHMSWGHAVSEDMVRWRHLPIAIYEEDGIMIFSGCCVVDHDNTSGLGARGRPPLVAIYSGHGRREQTQNLAYSHDRGRTWTKYDGNPVIDLNSSDFRDPKVFWHKPTQRWVMVVSLALQHRLLFFGSTDLKHWEKLSEFGPAGAPQKPNWECPDLFELPIEDEPGQTAWVLEVDLGLNAIAGGSGGEYFVGDFDGVRFIPHEPLDTVRWVDYGRDFYAPVSFSDIPEHDGRRIWIGWMNNWETHRVPTHPWRGAMSIPRTLTLKRVGDALILHQRPIRELQALRGQHVRLESAKISGTRALDPPADRSKCCEILVELRLGQAEQAGIRVHKGKECETEIGYEASTGTLYVDRVNSGIVDFHERFPGRHAAPLPLRNGKLKLQIFVDRSSVEVFANEGAVVMTDRVFPLDNSDAIELFSVDGAAEIVALDFWSLGSCLRRHEN